jgi:transcriptional regulator with XRE-family HTH domain
MMTGREIASLMRKHGVTIREIADRMGITLKRVREVRTNGLNCPHYVRDWTDAICG